MRDLFSFSGKNGAKANLKANLGAAFGALLGLLALGESAEAANPFELNFWLSARNMRGGLPLASPHSAPSPLSFRKKRARSGIRRLQITAYGRIHETAYRPWQSDNIPRRYCSGDVMLSDGKVRTVHFSIIEDGGFASYSQGVEWCVTGLDRNWAYNPACNAAKP